MSKKSEFVFIPIIIWGVLIYLNIKYIYPFIVGDVSRDSILLIVGYLIAERVLTCVSTIDIITKRGLNSNLWVILALVLGVNQLLFLNIAIWIKSTENKKVTS